MAILTAGAEIPFDDPSRVAEARRTAVQVGRRLGLNEDDLDRLALVATELGTNLVRYAQEGSLLVAPGIGGMVAVDLYALDRGPGIIDVAQAMTDGYSTSGASGSGLGAIRRHADLFEVTSSIGVGTVIAVRVGGAGTSMDPWQVAGLAIPYPGESLCGDACLVVPGPRRLTLAVIDGVGHGEEAANASARAATVVEDMRDASPTATLGVIHERLRSSRGAVAGIAVVDLDQRLVRYAGVGNITGVLLGDQDPRHLVSVAGTLGHRTAPITESAYPFPAGSRLVMHSDGLSTHFAGAPFAGGTDRHPLIQVALRIHDRRRLRDDLSIVMIRETPRLLA